MHDDMCACGGMDRLYHTLFGVRGRARRAGSAARPPALWCGSTHLPWGSRTVYQWILPFRCCVCLTALVGSADVTIIKPHHLLENGSSESNGNWRNVCIIGRSGRAAAHHRTLYRPHGAAFCHFWIPGFGQGRTGSGPRAGFFDDGCLCSGSCDVRIAER